MAAVILQAVVRSALYTNEIGLEAGTLDLALQVFGGFAGVGGAQAHAEDGAAVLLSLHHLGGEALDGQLGLLGFGLLGAGEGAGLDEIDIGVGTGRRCGRRRGGARCFGLGGGGRLGRRQRRGGGCTGRGGRGAGRGAGRRRGGGDRRVDDAAGAARSLAGQRRIRVPVLV